MTDVGSVVVTGVGLGPADVGKVTVEAVEPGEITIVTVKIPGLRGPTGASGSGAPIPFTLTGVSSQTFAHPFDHDPIVLLQDSDGELCETRTIYTAGHVYLEFPAPFTGKLQLLP